MFQSGPQHIVHYYRLFKLSEFTLNGLHCIQQNLSCISPQVTLMTPAKQDGERFEKILEKTRRRMKEVKTGQDSRLVSDVKLQWVINTLDIRHQEFSTNFVAAYKVCYRKKRLFLVYFVFLFNINEGIRETTVQYKLQIISSKTTLSLGTLFRYIFFFRIR